MCLVHVNILSPKLNILHLIQDALFMYRMYTEMLSIHFQHLIAVVLSLSSWLEHAVTEQLIKIEKLMHNTNTHTHTCIYIIYIGVETFYKNHSSLRHYRVSQFGTLVIH